MFKTFAKSVKAGLLGYRVGTVIKSREESQSISAAEET